MPDEPPAPAVIVARPASSTVAMKLIVRTPTPDSVSGAAVTPTGPAAAVSSSSTHHETVGLLNSAEHHSTDTLAPSASTSSVTVLVHPEELVKHAEIGKSRGAKNYLSRIFRGGFHLRRLVPLKDLLVPSGPQADMLGSMFNLINATFGAGMLSLPFATQKVGLVLAILFVVMFAILTVVTLRLMVEAAERCSASTYEVLMFKSFGIWGARVVDVLTVLGSFGAMIAYHVIIADFIAPILATFVADPAARAVLADPRFVMALFDIFIILPLCMRNNLNALRFTAVISCALVLFFVVVLVYIAVAFVQVRGGLSNPFRWAHIDFGLFSALPLFCLSFVVHTSAFPIYAEMDHPDAERFTAVAVRADTAVGAVYLVVAVAGYVAFGDDVRANIIAVFPPGAVVVLIVRVAYAVLLAFVFPFSQFTARLSIEHLWHGIEGRFNTIRHYVLTVALVLLSYGVAATGVDVSVVFGFTGSIGASCMMLIFPGACYVRQMPGPLRSPAKIGAVAVVVFGVLVMTLGIVNNALALAGVKL